MKKRSRLKTADELARELFPDESPRVLQLVSYFAADALAKVVCDAYKLGVADGRRGVRVLKGSR